MTDHSGLFVLAGLVGVFVLLRFVILPRLGVPT